MAWVHRNIGYDASTGIMECSNCGPVPAYRARGTRKDGVVCSVKAKADVAKHISKRGGSKNYDAKKTFKKNAGGCQAPGCANPILDLCQLELDHIDENPLNNDPSNWQVLCANCHRLKTYKPDLFWAQKKGQVGEGQPEG